MEAFKWRRLDKERELHKSAWLSRKVNATNDKGKYLFKDFDKFFNEKEYKKELGLASNYVENEMHKRMKEVAMKVNKKEVK